MRDEPEVYRFAWHSSFHGDAVVRIEHHGDEVTLRWFYHGFSLPVID
jgi:hemin uptake protein HemP